MGYRHIDTAFIYGGEKTETEVGDALTSPDCPVPRSEIFLTTKQWRAHHGYDNTMVCLEISLKRLKTPYVDLYLIHWPGPAYNTMARSKDAMAKSPDGPFIFAKNGHERPNMVELRSETWRAMEDSVFSGKCRSIGVSNFAVHHLEALRKSARIWPPAVNQIELHPYNPQTKLVEYCRKNGILVEAYASLGGQDSGKKTWKELGGQLLERPELIEIAEKHKKTAAQVLLRWATDQGYAVIPKSTQLKNMKENLEAVSMEFWQGGLDEMDRKAMASLNLSHSGSEAVRLCWVRDPLRKLDFE